MSLLHIAKICDYQDSPPQDSNFECKITLVKQWVEAYKQQIWEKMQTYRHCLWKFLSIEEMFFNFTAFYPILELLAVVISHICENITKRPRRGCWNRPWCYLRGLLAFLCECGLLAFVWVSFMLWFHVSSIRDQTNKKRNRNRNNLCSYSFLIKGTEYSKQYYYSF